MTSLEEVKRAADEYNKIAANAKKAGLQQFLHNETLENSKLERRPADLPGPARVLSIPIW